MLHRDTPAEGSPPVNADTRPRCTTCGHPHTGDLLAGVCIDCDCRHRGGAR